MRSEKGLLGEGGGEGAKGGGLVGGDSGSGQEVWAPVRTCGRDSGSGSARSGFKRSGQLCVGTCAEGAAGAERPKRSGHLSEGGRGGGGT